jgi:hypothetical protein
MTLSLLFRSLRIYFLQIGTDEKLMQLRFSRDPLARNMANGVSFLCDRLLVAGVIDVQGPVAGWGLKTCGVHTTVAWSIPSGLCIVNYCDCLLQI